MIECWTVLVVTLETRIRSDSSCHAVHVTEVAIERYLPSKIIVHLCMLDKAEIDAMQALSPEIFNKTKNDTAYQKGKKAKKAKSVSDVPTDCEKLAAHFSKLR